MTPVAGIFPETTLRTERLVLRPFTAADIPDTQLSCADELTQQWLPLPHPYTLDTAAEYCTQAHQWRESGDGIVFAVADPDSNRLLASLHIKEINWRALTSEVDRAGFTREGVLRNAGITHSGRVDLVVFSLIRRDLV